MSRITLTVFLVAGLIFLISLPVWLVVMIVNRSPRWPRRITLAAAGLAIAALVLNAYL
ncbi:hypothetical protein [Lacticaseibacillus daqingensis]|uniref:hypothetical protein n=1 Tax=Lacticaseibacillus daqingensis TaxID=2486014 RepID=UPI0013DDE6C3|nr:hypothetical protein [Lacticaseibacillus daqingensis]